MPETELGHSYFTRVGIRRDHPKEQLEFLAVDLMSLDSVRQFANEILAKKIPIQILANNAGIMFGAKQVSPDGFEAQMATNYFGHFLLTHLLMPRLKEAGTSGRRARVVNTSSFGHHGGYWMDFEDIHCKNFYHPGGSYGNSKVSQILFTHTLNRKLQEENMDVDVVAFHPGVVYTGLYDRGLKWATTFFSAVMKTSKQGSDALVFASISKSIEGHGGIYIDNSQIVESSSFSRNLDNQRKLWDISCQLLGIKTFGNPKSN